MANIFEGLGRMGARGFYHLSRNGANGRELAVLGDPNISAVIEGENVSEAAFVALRGGAAKEKDPTVAIGEALSADGETTLTQVVGAIAIMESLEEELKPYFKLQY